jgi:diguanylate cyclase (GGDEF)-like protein
MLLAGTALGLLVLRPAGAFWQHGPSRAAAALLVAAVLASMLALCLAWRAAAARRAPPQTRDALTGLPAHAGFRERLEGALSLARRQGWRSSVLVLDLRDFRRINEMHGRAGGDTALQIVAARLRNAVRQEDLVGRLGVDRFAVVQTALRDAAGALELAERLAATLADPLPVNGVRCPIAVDIGIALAPDDGDEACLLLDRAEDALTAARAAPRPSIHCFAPAQEADLRARRQLERDLHDAIEAGALHLHWQPQRRLADRSLIGFEALLRWNHPERGPIPPDRFIPIAEATGLIVPLGAWVLRVATMEASGWPRGLKVAVNLSAAQVKAGGLVRTVAEALHASGLPPHRLELEITESVLLQDSAEAARVMAGLQALGVSIALDDFGTGWSSLAYLRRFPFDELKIDRQFLRDLDADAGGEAVVAAILGLGRGLGLRVVAEGVETQKQVDRLLALGCERGQGWLLGRPMPADQARALITEEIDRTPTAA